MFGDDKHVLMIMGDGRDIQRWRKICVLSKPAGGMMQSKSHEDAKSGT